MDRLKRLWIGKSTSRSFIKDRSAIGFTVDSQEEQLLSSSISGSPFGVMLAALNGHLLKANPALCKMLGYSSEDILQLGLQGITHPEDLQKSSYFNQLLAGTASPVQVEKRYLHSSGRIVWALSSATVIQNNFGQPQYLLIQVQDLTEYKQTENALLKSQSLLRGVVHATPDVVFIKDALGRYVISNDAGLRLLGKTADEIIGKNDTSIYSASEAERIAQIDFQAMQDGETKSYEATVTLDGAARAFLFTESPYYGTSGEALGLVVVARDITEHQQAAERLENSRAELRALSAQLQSVREQERLHIAREIHDELGQVLTGLKIDVVSLTKRLSEASVKPNWEQLKERTQSIAELINSAILTVRRISTELRPGLLDVVGLTAAIEWQATDFEKRTGIKCNLRLPSDKIELDQNRSIAVFRIFQEILTNVVRHAQATEISVTLKEQEGNLLLEAKDNGRGVRASELSNPKSLGVLGMRERTLLLAGEFTIRGMQGKGTQVTVRIPLETKTSSTDTQQSC